jgi:hypothetical protein
MAPFLDSIKRSYVDVEIRDGGGVDTEQFLEATESLVTIFGMMFSYAAINVKTSLAQLHSTW